MRAVDHIDGNYRNNSPENLRLVGTDDNARASTLTTAERATLARLLQRRGLMAVTCALADMVSDAELANQAAVLKAATKADEMIRNGTLLAMRRK
jgi:HNH endonuclease